MAKYTAENYMNVAEHLKDFAPSISEMLRYSASILSERDKDQPVSVPDVRAMVDRFLVWRLPDDFYPDAGIKFNPPKNPDWWPIGTNLLTDPQAEEMFRYVLASAPTAPAGDARDAKCWALHFKGPDDVVAAPSLETAQIVARNFNAIWDEHRHERNHDVHVVAEVIEWTHGCIEHAKSVVADWPEYAELLDDAAIAKDSSHD